MSGRPSGAGEGSSSPAVALASSLYWKLERDGPGLGEEVEAWGCSTVFCCCCLFEVKPKSDRR